jgi:Ca2+-binding RTX toxin-like protein
VGFEAGKGANSNTTSGQYNVSLGAYSFDSFTSATDNTIIGRSAGHQISSGDYNVCLGTMAGDNLTTGANNTYLGYNSDCSANSVNDEIVLKAGSDTLVGGGTETIRIGVDSDYIVNDFGENATWTHSSDRRIKKNIIDNDLGLEFIKKLKTRKFQKKAPSEYPEEFEQHNPNTTERKNPDRIHYGFVAQEVKEAMDDVGHSEFPVWSKQDDGMELLGEAELITPLVKAVQELTEKNERLQNKINDLEIFIMDKLGDE